MKLIHGWSEVTTAYYAMKKLKGYARNWYDKLQSVSYSWDEWKLKLRTAFPEETSYHGMLSEMMMRTQRKGETALEYYYDKVSGTSGNV